MDTIKALTDAELVEAVAREVLEITKLGSDFEGDDYYQFKDAVGYFDPFTDMNDLQMVKDKLREMGFWADIKISPGEKVKIKLHKNGTIKADSWADNEPRAWLEAALAAERGKP
jgi:hypothetical protein